MRQFAGLFIFLVVMVPGFISCKKEKDPGPDMGYNYFPEKVGQYVIYDVDSFYYDDITVPSTIDTFKFQIKEKIQSVYPDNQNRPTLRLERYIRNYNPFIPYSSIPWVLRDVWAANRTATTAEKVEENVRYIKLAFAVREGQSWDGNAQNINGELTYKYQFFDQPRTVAGHAFDSVLQVNQENDENLIQKKYYIEKYARRTGLIYKQVIDIASQPVPTWNATQLAAFYALPIMQRVTAGSQYTYTYNSSGTE